MVECILGKTLVIIGGGEEQVPAYLRARERGLTVVGTDMRADAPALQHADITLLASTRDVAESTQSVVEFSRNHPVDGVMTIANDVPYTVASVAEALGLPSIGLDGARCASDKLLMKQRFRKHDVACPWFSAVGSLDELKSLTQDREQQRYVLKPVDGRGARGVLMVDRHSDLEWCFNESKRWGDSGAMLLEHYIPGVQLSTESFILDGKCYTAGITERNYSRLEQFAPYFIEDGGTMPIELDQAQLAAVDELILAGAAAMGIHEGVVKGDLVIDPEGRPVIIELAARLSGGWFATDQIPAASGIHLVDAVISHALGEPIDPSTLRPQWDRAVAIRYWFPEAGTITSITGSERLEQMESVLKYGFFRKVGDLQPRVKTHPDRFGYVITVAEDRQTAVAEIEQALAAVEVVTEQ